MIRLFDAHNHLGVDQPHPDICASVTNATNEEDWDKILNLANRHPSIIPGFGVHPWFVDTISPEWKVQLGQYLKCIPSTIGEIGLDRGKKGGDFSKQRQIFSEQFSLACALNLPVTIHCVKAFGELMSIISSFPRAAPGFLMHSYNGSLDFARALIPLGAYFSLPPESILEQPTKLAALIKGLPLDRLLIESDKPLGEQSIILEVYQRFSEIRGLEVALLSTHIEENFCRLFGAQRRQIAS